MAWGWVARRPNSCPESPWPEKAGEQVGTSDRSLAWGSYIWRQPVRETVEPAHRREASAPSREDLTGIRLLQDLVLLLAHLPPPLLLLLSCPSKFLPSSLASSWFLHSRIFGPCHLPYPLQIPSPQTRAPWKPSESFLSSPIPSSFFLSPSFTLSSLLFSFSFIIND